MLHMYAFQTTRDHKWLLFGRDALASLQNTQVHVEYPVGDFDTQFAHPYHHPFCREMHPSSSSPHRLSHAELPVSPMSEREGWGEVECWKT